MMHLLHKKSSAWKLKKNFNIKDNQDVYKPFIYTEMIINTI